MEGIIVIRCASEEDAPAIARLAELDSSLSPRGRLLLALVDGELEAALSLDGGQLVANPFRRTQALAAMLRLRAEQERAGEGAGRVEGRLRRRLGWPRVQAEGARG